MAGGGGAGDQLRAAPDRRVEHRGAAGGGKARVSSRRAAVADYHLKGQIAGRALVKTGQRRRQAGGGVKEVGMTTDSAAPAAALWSDRSIRRSNRVKLGHNAPLHHNPAPGDDAIRQALARAVAADRQAHPITAGDVRPLPQKGIAHRRCLACLGGTGGWLARVPKLSQFALAAGGSLTYQAACFARAAANLLHPPAPCPASPPSATLPMGALVIDAIAGEALKPTRDMALVAVYSPRCTACQCRRRPRARRSPITAIRWPAPSAFIEDQARYINAAVPMPEVRRALAEELAWARRFADRVAGQAQPQALVLSDTHPGNFLRAADGKAWFVDLEKALYGAPAVDLAHASLFTSTTWGIAAHGVLDRDAVMAFYGAYLAAVPAERAAALRPWLNDMRRLTWLRTTTWSCKWAATRSAAAARAVTPTRPPMSPMPPSGPAVRARIVERLRIHGAGNGRALPRRMAGRRPLDLARMSGKSSICAVSANKKRAGTRPRRPPPTTGPAMAAAKLKSARQGGNDA